MAKELKIYFRKKGSSNKLNNYPKSFGLLGQNWKVIRETVEEQQKTVVFNVTEETFANMKQEMGLPKDQKNIALFLSHNTGHFLTIEPEKIVVEEDAILEIEVLEPEILANET